MTRASSTLRRFAATSARPPSFIVLAVLSGVGPLATDMYLPALPDVGRSLGAEPATAQLTLTSFLVGLAIGQIVLGAVSDSIGRRRLLILGPAFFVLTSIACALAPNAAVFIVARLVQGFAAGAGVVCARAVVSDYYPGDQAARKFGLLASVTLLAPMVAPALGAALLLVGDWRLMFVLLAAVGVLQIVGVLVGVHETLPTDQRHPGSLGATLRRMGDLLRDRAFILHVAVVALATIGFFSYIGGSSFVLQSVYGIDTTTYGIVFSVNATAMAAMSFVFSRIAGRISVVMLRRIGLSVSASSAAALAVLALALGAPAFPVVWVLLALVAGGMGFSLPASIALSQEAGMRARGTAAALSSGISFSTGAAIMPVTGLLDPESLVPMAVLMAVFLVAALALSPVAKRVAPVAG